MPKNGGKFHTEAIVNDIILDLINGYNRLDILTKLRDDQYSIPTKHLNQVALYNYIKKAYAQLSDLMEEERQLQRELFYNRMSAVYNDAMVHNDRTNAISALKELAKVAKLYDQQENKVEITDNKVTIKFGLGSEE